MFKKPAFHYSRTYVLKMPTVKIRLDSVFKIIPFLKNYKIIGSGANLLLNNYIKGVIILLDLNKLKINNNEIYVEAGVNLQKLIDKSIEYCLDGLHNFTYIPSNVGGAIYMNIHYNNGNSK